MAAIALERLGKTYAGGVLAVEDVNLKVPDGELAVIVGPSGSGKSTLLRLIAGLESPTSGRILVGERDVTQVPPHARDLAMVFQSYALYPHKTVRENLAFGLRMRGVERRVIDDRILRVAEVAADCGTPGSQAGAAIGRSAAAGGPWPGDRPRAPSVPLRRAVVESRSGPAARDARRAATSSPAACHHDRPCHARSGRGHDTRTAPGHHARRPCPAGRRAAGCISSSREPVRGAVHRFAAHERVPGNGLGRGGPACRPRAWASRFRWTSKSAWRRQVPLLSASGRTT